MPLPALDPVTFHRDALSGLLEGERGALAEEAGRDLGAMALEVGGDTWTYRIRDGRLEVVPGSQGDVEVQVALDASAWSDLAQSIRTLVSLQLAGAIRLRRGTYSRLARWDGVLRALYLGIPVYDPDRVALSGPDGAPLDLARSFTLDDPDEDLATFLRTTGYLHVRRVFAPDEVARLAAESERIEGAVDEDDPHTWWAADPDGTRVLCRVIYAHRHSAYVAGMADDPRLHRLAALLGTPVQSYSDRMDGPTLLLKPAGELVGLANLPWHQDCGLGGHPFTCPSVGVGVQITGSSAETGFLEVIAGSHGQTVRPDLDEATMAGWPRVGVPTAPGDVTVHVQDVVHASPAPSGRGGRKTLYFSYYPPGLADHVGPGEAVNDLIRGRQTEADALRAR